MLEIKSYDDWTEEEEELAEDPVSNIKKYTDYVRLNYSKAGILNPETDSEIAAGVQDRLNEEVFTEDMTEEDRNGIFSSIVGPDKNDDADARFVLDYLKAEGQQDDARVQNLTQYLSMKQLAPDRAEEFRQPVADIIGDRKLVRDSRVAAADRGDFSVVAIEEDNGDRTFYSGPSAKPEKVSGEIDSLIKAGAISTSDLSSISGYVKPINGGLSTTSEATRYDIFRSTVGEKAKADKELGGLLQNQAGTLRQQKEEEQRTTGEAVLEGAKTVIAYPFAKLADAVMAAGSFLTGEEKPEPKYAPDTKLSDVLGSDENLRKKFSAEEIEKFSDAMVADAAGAVFRADKPETGITTDSMGNPIIAAALLPRDDLFEKALAAAPLNKDQQKMARVRRDQLLDTTAPELLKVILEEEPDAVGMLAKAKADGLSDAEFVKTYVSDSKNYSGFETRLEQFGKSAWKTVAEIPLGLAALSGNEWAAKEMVKMNKDQSRRQEFSRMFGDEYGIGFQLLNTIPQVATDIGLTIGTGGVFAGAKTLAKAGSVSSKTALRSMAKLGLSGVDDVAAQSFRTASTAGGEAATSNAIKEVGRSLATKFAENAPVFTTSFVRSATSTYGSIYGQLPDEMSHEEKHKNALGYSLAAGLSTGVITSGMSFLGRGGVEEVATKRIRAMLGGETDDAVLAAGGRVVPVDKMNYRQAKAVYENLKSESVPVTDRAFQRAMRGAIGGAYKNYMRTTFGGVLNEATEEMVDQAIQMKLEDAALDQETPLSEKVNQIFTAGVIGGGLGGIVAGATQFGPVKKSELALVFEGRASALEKVATQLRKTNSNATAETVQRMIDDARTRAAEVTQAEAQAKIQEEKNAELATKKPIFADPAEKQLSDEKEQELELTMLGDLVGEKVSAAGFTGTLEADDSGSIFLNTKDGETIHLGSRYEKAQGRVSAFPQLMTFAKDEGKVLAGTPYIVRGKKATSKVAMPSVTENNRPEDFLGVIKDKGNIIQLVVKGATLMSNQDLDGMDIKISNGYQIKSLARYYNVSLDSLQDLTPPPTDSDVNASSIDEIETNAVSDEAKASIVTAKEVLQYGPNQNLFKAFMAGDSSKAKFKQTVTNLTPDELNFIAQNANTFFDWVSSDDTIPAETRGALLQSAEDLKSRVALAYKFQVDQAAKEAFANEPDLTDEEKAAIEDELKQDLEGDGEEATAPKTQLTSKEQEAENKRLKGVITGAPKEPTAVKTRKTPEGNSVVEGPSPQDQLRKLMADYSDMEFVVPIVATREGPKTFAGATKYRKKLEFLEDIAYSDAATEEFSAELAELKVSMAKGKQAIGSRRRRLRMKMASLMPAEVGSEETTLTQSEQDLASQLSAIEASRPFKTFEEEEEAQEKRTKKKRVDHGGIAGEDWSTEDKLNVFRNQEEELAFNDLVLGGFRISDLSAYGRAIAGLTQEDMGYGEVPLFTKQRLEGDPTDPMKYLKGKHKFLYRKVIENYPLVTPTSKDEPVTSKRSYTNVETGEYRTIPIPVFRDASYDAVAGEFTNDPIIIREQIDQNIPVTIPKQLIKRSENAKDAFKINPSIEFDPDTGVVMSVIDPITRQPIRFSGEEAYVNGSYIPIKARKTESLLMSLVAPSGRYLSSAGETAKGRQSIGQQVVNNKVVPAKNLNARDYTGDFQKWMMGEVAFDGEFERGAGHRFLKSEFQLDDDSISDLSSYALAEYGLSVYEFAMGKALLDYAAKSVKFEKNKSITKRLTKAAEEKGLTLEQYKEHPDFASEFNLTKESLRDLNPVGVVADFFYTNSKEAMATAIAERHPNLSGSTAHNVITKYAEFLYERVNEPDGDLFTGPKNPLNILKKFGKDYQNAEKARNIRKTVFFRGIGEDNESVLDTLLATGKLNDYALDPLFSSSRDMVDDDPETATTYRISLRDSLIRQINDTPELKRAMKDIALLFHKGFEVLESGEMIVDVLNNKIVSITGDNRDISMAIVNRLSGLKTGLRAAGVMSELGWLPPVAKFEAIPPTVEPPASFESPTASKDRLIELVDKAKESAYRAGGKTTPQEEVAYRNKIIEAVRVAQPEIQEAFAAAETLRRKGDLRERYEQSIKSVFNKMDTETINAAVNKLSQTISNNRSKLDKFDEQIELVNSEITEAGLSLSNIFNEINVQRRALGLGARPESELLADLSSEGEFKQPTAAELSSLERPQPTATPKQVKVKKTKAAERAQLALPQLTDSYNMALSNVRFHTRKKNSVTRDKEVSIALIERLNPLMQRIDDVMVDDMSETEKIGTVEAILTRALTGDPADTRAATDYKKASESMKLKASGIVEETTELKGYEKIARMAAPALMKMRNDVTRLNKSVSNVNSAELEQAARIANSEDVARYALESNDPESVLTALRIISKSKVEHHREVAKLLLLAPDFVRSVKFGIVDVRSDWAGIYDSESNAVMVNLSGHNGRGLADVLLHEYLHAATVTYLNDPRTAEQRAAVQRINQLRELAIAQATKKGLMRYAHVRNGLANNAEFLTYTITAPEFQSMLAAMTPTGQRSILSRMIDAILSFFGKKNTLLNKAIKELFDFSQMSLASYHTFNISSRRDIDGIVQIAQDARVAFEDKVFFGSMVEDILTRYEGGGEGVFAAESTGPFDAEAELRRIVPAGINIEIDNNMVAAMGIRRSKPNTIIINQEYVAELGTGLSQANAKAVIRTAVDEELAHIAANSVFTNDDYLAIAKELGPDMVNRILDITYSNMEPDDAIRASRIAADREAGLTGDLDAAAEWVRMEMTRMATGRTREVDIAFFYTNPSLLERFLEGLKAFIVKLKQQFRATPTTGTAAHISQASRSFRKLRNGGVLPTPEPSAANEYGDTTAFFNAINGDIAEGQEDRTYFMFPVAGTGASKQKTKDFWKMAQDKMYNLPMELRKYLNMRDGTISQIEYTIEDFDRRFPKLRDEALARGASIEDIGMILGTTAPAVQGEARKEIQRKVREFKKDNATDPDLERKAEDYEAQLTQPEADKFFAAFRKEQQAMESKLKNSGFGELVDYLVEFRNEINKYKAVINFDESNDVYLTRTFRFFGSEGWALFAKEGGVAMIDGKEVDFNKLRAAAAKHFEWEVDNDAKQNGQTLTAEQRDKKLIEYLDKYLANLEQEAADAKDLGAMNTVRKDVNRLLRKKDFDAPLRTLLGEVTDPFENAVRTVYSVGRLAANEKFLRNFASKAIEIEVASRTRKPDMELLFPPSQSAQLGDLAGLYVRKDIAATIREELGMNGIKQQSKAMETLNSLGRAMSKFSGLSITAKTLGSVGFYPRNVLGGIALTTAQGIINPVYMKEAMRLSIISNMSLGGNVKADTQETRNQIRRLTELQILKDETRGRIAMDMLNGFVNSTDQQLEELLDAIVEAQGSGNIEKIVKKFNLEGTWAATKQAGGSTVEFLASLNNVIDSAFKLNAYFFELNALKEAYGDTESESKLEVDAARKVKLTFPTHSDQLSLAKAFNKSPFAMIALPFVRWKTEVFRTMFNTVPLAVEEMKSGNPVMRSRGVKRLVGFTTTMIGGSAAYGALFATLFSFLTDDEDDERGGVRELNEEELVALREGLPKWQRNHGIFAQLLQDGSVQVIDMSNILPYSQLTDMVGLATRGDIKGMADYFSSEMIGTQIAANTAIEVAQNRDQFDQPIWLATDNAVVAFGKMAMHLIGGTLQPAIIDKVIKVGRYGEQNAKEIIVGELTGVRPIIHKTTDIEYRGMRNLKESADAVVSLLYPLSSGRGLNPDEVEGIIDDHQSASNKNQQKLHNFLMGMQSIGSTESSLATTAKQMKFSKQRFGAALEGVNIPWVPNEQWFRKMIDNKMRVGEQDPDEIANEINRVLTQKADVYSTNFLE
jgi:hypothetical protein